MLFHIKYRICTQIFVDRKSLIQVQTISIVRSEIASYIQSRSLFCEITFFPLKYEIGNDNNWNHETTSCPFPYTSHKSKPFRSKTFHPKQQCLWIDLTVLGKWVRIHIDIFSIFIFCQIPFGEKQIKDGS